MKSRNVHIDKVNDDDSVYIIRDATDITVGRIKVIELDTANRSTSIRLKFYRINDSKLLEEALDIFCKAIFKDSRMFKLNIIVSEDADINTFLNMGFVLEGIITENIITNNVGKSELLFGININDYNQNKKINHIALVGKDIVIRNLTPGDAEAMLNFYIRNEEHLMKYEPQRDKTFYTLNTQYAILKDAYKEFIKGTDITLGIFKEDNLIGRIKISNIVYGIFKSCYLGYAMDKDNVGRGYMKESVTLVIDYIFNEMELHRVEASTLVDNVKSQAVLKANGFNELGINKEYLYINGEWRDHIIFYKTKQ